MKKIISLLVLIVLFTGCAETKLHTEQYNHKNILVGEGQIKDIRKGEYKKWFDENSLNYSPREDFIKKLRPQINDYRFEIVMGTWCPDSRMQVPVFYKVLKKSGYENPEKIAVIYVPRKYKEYKKIDGMNIKRVPTIIVLKNEKEIGRIIEYPMQSIEEDLVNIIEGNYRHELSQ